MFGAGLIALLSLAGGAILQRKPVHKPMGIVMMSLVAAAAIGMTVFGQKYTSASNAAVLATLAVITTIYFSHLILRQTVPASKFGWVLLLVAGVYLAVMGFSGYEARLGDWIIIASSVFFGLSNTMSKPLLAHNSPSVVRDVRFVISGLIFGIAILFSSSISLVTSAGMYPLIASLCFWLAIYCYYKAVAQIGPAHAIIINNAHPVLTVLASALVLAEHITTVKLIGIVLTIFAIYMIANGRLDINLKAKSVTS